MDKEDKLLKIDEILAGLEDFLHGKIGEKVTEARKELVHCFIYDPLRDLFAKKYEP